MLNVILNIIYRKGGILFKFYAKNAKNWVFLNIIL